MSENKKKNDENTTPNVDAWKVVSFFGKGVVKSVQWIGNAPENISNMISDGIHGVRDAMSITRVSAIFNTTDETVQFINQEAPHDNRDIPPRRAIQMRSRQVDGAFIPWYDPPNNLRDFSLRHMVFLVDGKPVVYIWQRGHYVYWCNTLNSLGQPEKQYKVTGISEVGGQRLLVFRYDPDFGYSVFLNGTGEEEDETAPNSG